MNKEGLKCQKSYVPLEKLGGGNKALTFGIIATSGNDGTDINNNNWKKLTVTAFSAGAGSAALYLRNSGQSISTTTLNAGTVVDISNATDFSIRLTRNVGNNGCQCTISLE